VTLLNKLQHEQRYAVRWRQPRAPRKGARVIPLGAHSTSAAALKEEEEEEECFTMATSSHSNHNDNHKIVDLTMEPYNGSIDLSHTALLIIDMQVSNVRLMFLLKEFGANFLVRFQYSRKISCKKAALVKCLEMT